MKTVRKSIVVFIALFALTQPGEAIGPLLGDIEGFLTLDGLALPGATIILWGELLPEPRVTTSSSDGSFRFTQLPVGRYQLELNQPGFLSERQSVAVQVGASRSIHWELSTGLAEPMVVAMAISVDEPAVPTAWVSSVSTNHPTWNSWFEERGLANSMPLGELKVGRTYDFVLDLSLIPYKIAGVASGPIADELADELLRAYQDGEIWLRVNIRPVVTGSSLRLIPGSSRIWRRGDWSPSPLEDGLPMEIELAALLNSDGATDRRVGEIWSDVADRARAGGVRFSVSAEKRGCSSIAISILDERSRIPIDAIIRNVSVGNADCGPDMGQLDFTAGFVSLLRSAPTEIDVAGALQLLEIRSTGGRSGRTVALYVPKEPVDGCRSFGWELSTTLSQQLFDNGRFREMLQAAREDDRDRNPYPLLAAHLRSILFPSVRGAGRPCDRKAALEALRLLAASPSPTLYISLISPHNDRLFAPIGLLFALEEEVDGASRPYFEAPPAMIQPLPGQTHAHRNSCIRHWYYFLPESLKGVGAIRLPLLLEQSRQTKRTIDDLRALIEKALEDPSTLGDEPIGIVLLAHHDAGTIYFDDVLDSIPFNELQEARFPPGSVALLAACSTGDILADTDLVSALGEAGFGSVLLSPFPVAAEFGQALAESFAVQVEGAPDSEGPRVEELFQTSLQTAETLGWRGMALEFLIAGWARTRVCRPLETEETEP